MKHTKYAIFRTKWGYFGLVGTKKGLFRTHLPAKTAGIVRGKLLAGIERTEYQENLFAELQERIIAYFAGNYRDFDNEIPVILSGFSEFGRSVLCACRNIRLGETKSYSELAMLAGRPNAARAAGNILSRNPLPLIIPCHRVIRSDGRFGGFSAAGQSDFKAKLLRHEQDLS